MWETLNFQRIWQQGGWGSSYSYYSYFIYDYILGYYGVVVFNSIVTVDVTNLLSPNISSNSIFETLIEQNRWHKL